jgi:hypothetical protein
MIYAILSITIVENIILAIIIITKFIEECVDNDINVTDVNKKSSIIIDVNLNKKNNITEDALYDYITNLGVTISFIYTNNQYILNNNNDCVLIDENDKIYFSLRKESIFKILHSIEFYSYNLNAVQLRSFFDEVTNQYKHKLHNSILGSSIFYFNEMSSQSYNHSNYDLDHKFDSSFNFSMTPIENNKKFTNIIGKESKLIEKRIDFFNNNKSWYDEKGILYTLGLLLTGPPGSGKTSIIKCVANKMKRHIFNVKLHSTATKLHLNELFFDEYIYVIENGLSKRIHVPFKKRIYVFEVINCRGFSDELIEKKIIIDYNDNDNDNNDNDNNDNDNDNDNDNGNNDDNKLSSDCPSKPALSNILNIIDDVLEFPERVIIMTSNNHNLLDKTLIKPGMFDLTIEIPYCDPYTIIELIETFYDIILIEEFIDVLLECTNLKMTFSEVVAVLLENFDSHINAVSKFMLLNLDGPQIVL